MSATLRARVTALGLDKHVRFLGSFSPERLHLPLSAADVFVLASSYEGWANVLLEAMACGLPVVATDVGGNAQVVHAPALGRIVPFGDPSRLVGAIDESLGTRWDRTAIRAHAESHGWETRIPALLEIFDSVVARRRAREGATNGEVAEHGHAR
jgi:glycosyltransferase involved in cell wall biosynthesis